MAYVTPGIVSNGHLTPGLDRNYGLTGDYWHLDTKRGHSYRIEVKFGDSPDIGTGGSAWIYFIDGDRRGSCCDSDHNREDGYTLLHVNHDRNRRYLVFVAAFDQLNENSSIYNGPYTITMTDITGTDKVTTNLYLGTRTDLLTVDSGSSRQYAVPFSTGHQPGGYELDRISTHITAESLSRLSPSLALHADTSFVPGDKLCDFRNPSVVKHRFYTRVVPFLAPDCAGQRLATSTTYWIVFAGTGYTPKSTDTNDQLTRRGGWSIGNVAATKTNGAWGNISDSDTIPVAIWAKKRHNPLSVSLEVTSDPTKGTNSDTYGLGDVITFEVKFSEAVTITGAPRLRFSITGMGDEYAAYVSGSGTNTLVFAYTVLATDADDNGIFLYNRPLSYPDAAATIVAVDDNLPVFDDITGQIITLSGHKIDGTITN